MNKLKQYIESNKQTLLFVLTVVLCFASVILTNVFLPGVLGDILFFIVPIALMAGAYKLSNKMASENNTQ